MKRVITILLTLVMILSFIPFVAYASSSAGRLMNKKFIVMTDDEILEMYDLIMTQFKRRNLSPYSASKGVAVPPGRYTVGVDIPAGIYRLEFPDDDYDVGTIYIYTTEEYPDKWYTVGKGAQVQVFGKLELVEGTIFDLQDTTATFYIYTGLFGDFNE